MPKASSAPADPSPQYGDPITVALLNVFLVPWMLSRKMKERKQIIVETLKEIDPDIISFQEVWFKRDKNYFKKELDEYEAHNREGFFPPRYHWSGLVTLSKLPIEKGEVVPWKEAQWYEKITRRAFNVVYVQSPYGKPLRIVNAHFSCVKNPETNDMMQSQREQMVEFLESEALPTIVTGDFNVNRYFQGILPSNYKLISPDEELTVDPENPLFKSGIAGKIGYGDKTCDLIFTNMRGKVIEKKVWTRPVVSDHYLVTSTFRPRIQSASYGGTVEPMLWTPPSRR
ncbi:MAG: endonuclease/exonuclease/phosphatase family protein [Nanoarchaeota archaeon]